MKKSPNELEEENKALREALNVAKIMQKRTEPPTIAKYAGWGLGLAVAILAVLLITSALSSISPVGIVGPGERGILIEFGAVKPYSLAEGLVLKIPIMQTLAILDVKTHKVTATASSASKDLQSVSTEITLNYHLNPEKAWKLYQEVGADYSEKVIQPAVQESVKAVTAHFNAEELVTQRPAVKEQIEQSLRDRLLNYSIIQETLSITDFSFSAEFDAAIESKVTAEQEALKAGNILRRIEIEAQQRVAESTGKAEAKIIEAQAEAEALRLQKEVIDEKLLRLRSIEKWDGIMPRVTGGALPFVDVAGIAETE